MPDEQAVMRNVLRLVVLFIGVAAQVFGQDDLTQAIGGLRTAVRNDSLASAADIADRLDDAVQLRYKASLIRDAGQRVQDVLSWLPDDTESLWVNQKPFTIKPEESLQLLYGRPIQVYSVDRLSVLNEGDFYRALANRTVRLVVAAGANIPRRIPDEGLMVPGRMAARDATYFYFFTEPVDLPTPDESIEGRPVWHATAKTDAGGISQRGVKRPERQSENWITLARPDLLILTNRHELLDQILHRLAGGSKSRALPADLPEWAYVNRRAPFWGLRHYSTQSRPKPGDPGFDAAELPAPDGCATGVTVQFDPAGQRLEVRYLSSARPVQEGAFGDLKRAFQVDHPESGVWRLSSDIQAKGEFPVHFALEMLGFGLYR
ncbi:MAG: hypothetical protein ABSF98_26365 [Bryobacteraceae bacterium]